MSEPVVIRLATVDDAPLLARHRVTMFEHMGTLPEASRAPLLAASEAWFASALPGGAYLAFLAEIGDDVVGGAGVHVRDSLPRASATPGVIDHGPEALVVNVFVEPAHRRRGIARRLMDAVMGCTRQRGILRTVLHASADGRALYEQLGFVATNEMRHVRVPPSPES